MTLSEASMCRSSPVSTSTPPPVMPCGHSWLTSRGELDDVLRDDAIDAVILCTPHKFHTDQIIAAAAHGKHVFCEKPLSTSGEEAQRAVDAITAAGLQLGIGHERRFEPAVVALRHAITDGELGTPLVFEGNFSQDKFLDLPPDNWRLSAVEAPVGPLSATGIHLVDLAISIFGRPTQVWARLSTQATSFANGDTLAITLAFEKGQTALITAILATPFVGRVTVLGSEGWVEIRDRNHPEDPQGWDVTTAGPRGGREFGLLPAAFVGAGEHRVVREGRRRRVRLPDPVGGDGGQRDGRSRRSPDQR